MDQGTSKAVEIAPENLQLQIEGMSNFDKELVAGSGVKKLLAEMKFSSRDLWQIKPSDITVLPGFNPRVQNRAYFEGVELLAEQIKEHGFYQDKPLACYIAKIDGVDRLVLHDGHRRFASALKAIEMGAPLKTLPVVLKERSESMIDLTLGLLHSNEGQPFSTYEKAVLAKRLKKFGWENKQIAAEFRCTAAFVGQLLTIAGAPQIIAELVQNGNMSATEAHRLMMQEGAEEAGKIASEGMAKAKAAGRTKITAKDLTPKEHKAKNAKKFGYELYFQLKKLRDDPKVEKLMDDKQIEAIDGMFAEIEKKPRVKAEPAPKKEPKKAAAKKPLAQKIAQASAKKAEQIKTKDGDAKGGFFDRLNKEQAEKKAGKQAGAQARGRVLGQRRSER